MGLGVLPDGLASEGPEQLSNGEASGRPAKNGLAVDAQSQDVLGHAQHAR